MADDVLINKAKTIERCIARIREVVKSVEDFKNDLDKQDVIILNLQRSCEAAIDMAAHKVREKRLGAPQSSRDFFVMLAKDGLISSELSQKMQAMVGFRDIAIHDYQEINLIIVESIVQNRLDDFLELTKALLRK